MDWRNRKYYLIHTSSDTYRMRHNIYNKIGHIKYHHNWYSVQDCYGHKVWQEIISCRNEDSEMLEYELRKAHRRDTDSYFMELNKLVTKQ